MKRPKTYLITDGNAVDSNFPESSRRLTELSQSAVQNGISYIQIREKNLNAANLFQLTNSIANVVQGSSTRLLVNDRADVAVAAGADGVHLTSKSISVADIRSAFGDRLIVFASTHSESDIQRVVEQGADAVVLGPVFDSPGKGKAIGLDLLRRACARLSPFEIIALGGIDESNCEIVLDAGASGFAGIRAFDSAEKITSIAKLLNKR